MSEGSMTKVGLAIADKSGLTGEDGMHANRRPLGGPC
jgi:hypothetical protein